MARDATPIDPRRVIGELRKAAPDDTLMITDTGNHQTWVEQYWEAYEPRSVFTPGGFAGMGFGTCGVLGMKLARPDRPAVCVTSDGSFMMFPGAIATAVEHDIPAVWVCSTTTRSASSATSSGSTWTTARSGRAS